MGCSSSTAMKTSPSPGIKPESPPSIASAEAAIVRTTSILLTTGVLSSNPCVPIPRLSDADSMTSHSSASKGSFGSRRNTLDPDEEMKQPSAIAAFAADRYTRERTLLATRDPVTTSSPRDDKAIEREWKELQAQVPGEYIVGLLRGTPSPKAHHPLLKQTNNVPRPLQVQVMSRVL